MSLPACKPTAHHFVRKVVRPTRHRLVQRQRKPPLAFVHLSNAHIPVRYLTVRCRLGATGRRSGTPKVKRCAVGRDNCSLRPYAPAARTAGRKCVRVPRVHQDASVPGFVCNDATTTVTGCRDPPDSWSIVPPYHFHGRQPSVSPCRSSRPSSSWWPDLLQLLTHSAALHQYPYFFPPL